jgi:hypothetical protein
LLLDTHTGVAWFGFISRAKHAENGCDEQACRVVA